MQDSGASSRAFECDEVPANQEAIWEKPRGILGSGNPWRASRPRGKGCISGYAASEVAPREGRSSVPDSAASSSFHLRSGNMNDNEMKEL